MPSATDHPAAASGALQRNRALCLTPPRWLGLAAVLAVLALVLAGPAGAATRAGGPSPDPAPPATGSVGPSPDPVPQATGASSVISQSSQGTTSLGDGPHVSGTVGSSLPSGAPYTVPATPTHSSAGVSTAPERSSASAATDRGPVVVRSTTTTAKHAAHRRKHHTHPAARQSVGQREAALAYQELRHQLLLASRTAGPISAAAKITSDPPRSNGALLLIGAGVLFSLAAASGALLWRLWRLHGQWYGGRPA